MIHRGISILLIAGIVSTIFIFSGCTTKTGSLIPTANVQIPTGIKEPEPIVPYIMTLSEYKTEMKKFSLLQHYLNTDTFQLRSTPEIRAKADELKDEVSYLTTINTVNTWVEENIRWIKQPNSGDCGTNGANRTFLYSRGDCTDLTALKISMLSYLGIYSRPSTSGGDVNWHTWLEVAIHHDGDYFWTSYNDLGQYDNIARRGCERWFS